MVEDRGSFLLPSNAAMMHTYQYRNKLWQGGTVEWH